MTSRNSPPTALPPTVALPMATIEKLRIGLLEALHEFREGDRRGFQEKMDMVGHQAVGVQCHVMLLAILREAIEVGLIVGGIAERLLPLVATGDDVVEEAGGKRAGTPGHTARSHAPVRVSR